MTQSPTDTPRVLMVGIDSADINLVRRWLEQGHLPNLAGVIDRGVFAPMDSSAELNGSPWISVKTGVDPGDHAYYNFLLWDAQRMRHRRPDADWPGTVPFWRDLSRDGGPYTVVLDFPDTFPGPAFNGLELGSWAGHYRMCPSYTLPPDRLAGIQKRFGKDPMPLEAAGLMSIDELFALRDKLLEVGQTQTRLAEELLDREPWDFFFAVYGTTHRAGHQLWNDTGLSEPVPDDRRDAFDRLLLDVYAAADAGLGSLLDKAGPETLVMVFAAHGMTENRTMANHLPEMVRRIVSDDDGKAQEEAGPSKPGLAKRLREAVPLSWRSAVKDRLPQSWQDALTLFWRTRNADWPNTPVFCLLPDLQGFIRVNLKGRERDGIVEPGPDYDAWLDKVEQGLRTFVDDTTGQPIVAEVWRPRDRYPQGTKVDELPDLVVDWPQRDVAAFESMSSPHYGRIRTMINRRAPEGRSGHHQPSGWLAVAGPGIHADTDLAGIHGLDLPPTLYRLFGKTPPEAFAGRAIPGIARS